MSDIGPPPTTVIIGASAPVARAVAISEPIAQPERVLLVDDGNPVRTLVREPAPFAGTPRDPGAPRRIWSDRICDGRLDGRWAPAGDAEALVALLRQERPARVLALFPDTDLATARAMREALRFEMLGGAASHADTRAGTTPAVVAVVGVDAVAAVATLAEDGAHHDGWRVLHTPTLLGPQLPPAHPVRRVVQHLLLGLFVELTHAEDTAREWLHVDDVAVAVRDAFAHALPGEWRRIAGHIATLTEVAGQIADTLDAVVPEYDLRRRDLLIAPPVDPLAPLQRHVDVATGRSATLMGLGEAARRTAHWYAANASLLADDWRAT